MDKKIILIDGHSILHRTFYGLPDLTNTEGMHTNAIYGFLNILFRLIEEEQPGYMAVAFDLSAPTFRHQMFDAYKGTRKPMPEELREQIPVMKEVLKSMGIRILSKEGYEADDILGTMAKRSEEAGFSVTVVSGDRDLLQLATDKIMVRIPKTRMGKTVIEDYHTAEVLEKYHVTPTQIIELKALMGDASDNIPGIPGVGEKTAAKIISEYGCIENAFAHVEEIKPKRAMESLRDHYDLAVLSKKLATINVESPIDCNPADTKIGELFTKEAYDWYRRLDFKNFLDRFEGQKDETPFSVETIYDFAEAESVFTNACKTGTIGIALIGKPDDPLGAALCFEERTVYIPAEGFLTSAYLKTKLTEILTKSEHICCMELKPFLKLSGIDERGEILDAHLLAYLLNPLKSSYSYDDIAKDTLGVILPAAEELFGRKKLPDAADMTAEQAAGFAGAQAWTALHAGPLLLDQVRDAGMERLYGEVELPLAFALADMEEIGVAVRKEELKTYGEHLQERISEVEASIYHQAGERFNINSPKQLGVILFEKLQLPGAKKTKSGYSTAADVLEKLAPEAPVVADILEYRQLTKLKSTYADGLAAYIGTDGRIRSTFHQTITATGRISSADPNLQNIPVRMELGREIRKVFVPEDGYVFVDADYSQIELRIMAHMSGDENLISAYHQDSDIHRLTASQVFHVPPEEVTSLQRRNAKAVNFGIIYGISSFGLSQDLSISRKEAAEYIQNYFDAYPGVKEYLEGTVKNAKEQGFVTTMYGRRRPMPELSSGNFMQRSFGERVAMNAPIQGTAADIMKIAMIRVARRLKKEGLKSRLILQVHDELLIEAPIGEVDYVSSLLREEMTGAADLKVTLEVDLHTGMNWFDAH